jgi:cytochrome P450
MTTAVPSHVPGELVVSFDHVSGADYLADPLGCWDALRDKGPILYSDQLGGFWVITDRELVRTAINDFEIFSNRELTIPPMKGPPLVPSELDPPEHGEYRKRIISVFAPRNIEQLDASIRETAAILLDHLEGRTEFDFVEEFAIPFPALGFARLCGLPDDDSRLLVEWIHHGVHGSGGGTGKEDLRRFLREHIEDRRGSTEPDLLSTIARAEIDGELISTQMAENMAFVLTLGGLHTTSGFLGLSWHWFATHPDQRRQIVADERSIKWGLDELLRVFSVANPARVVAVDTTWQGLEFKADERVLLGITAANRASGNEHSIPDYVPGRPATKPAHFAFGLRHHRCIGMHLARRQLEVVLQVWHERYPEYEFIGHDLRYTAGGGAFGVEKLQLRIP